MTPVFILGTHHVQRFRARGSECSVHGFTTPLTSNVNFPTESLPVSIFSNTNKFSALIKRGKYLS